MRRGMVVIQRESVDGLARALLDAAPADVLVVSGDPEGAPGWQHALHSAALERTDVATAVPAVRFGPRAIIAPVDSAAVLLTRRALTVLGFGEGESVEEFSRRASASGFVHILVGDVVVLTGGDAPAMGMVHRAIGGGSVDVGAELSPAPIVVGIDAELIDTALTGTFEAALGISLALARRPGISEVHWIAPPDRVGPLRELLATMSVDSISVATLDDLRAGGTAVDVAFRPYQDFFARTWPRISAYAARNIIWTLDLIANVTPSYARSVEDYHRLNRTSCQAWENADAIGVLTPHVGETLLAYVGHALDSRVFVLPAGAPARADDPGGGFEHEALRALAGREFVLVLGNSYVHKGRAWFIRLMRCVLDRGWGGAVVLAGPTPEFGSSKRLEAAEFAGCHAEAFIRAGRVGAADRARLLSRATLTVAPSVTEGWGLIPSEALAHGSTPLASLGGGLRDITPPDALSLLMSDDDADVATVEALLTDVDARARQRESWARGMARYSWESAAAILEEHMQLALDGPRHFSALVHDADVARDPVRPLQWRILDRILPQGGAFRSVVARVVRGSA